MIAVGKENDFPEKLDSGNYFSLTIRGEFLFFGSQVTLSINSLNFNSITSKTTHCTLYKIQPAYLMIFILLIPYTKDLFPTGFKLLLTRYFQNDMVYIFQIYNIDYFQSVLEAPYFICEFICPFDCTLLSKHILVIIL